MQYQIGDKLRRPGFPTYHDGIYVGPSSLYGEDVVHGDKAAGVVRLVRLSEFAAGQRAEVVSRARSRQDGWAIRQRALSLIGRRYDLLNFNCEHLANYAQTGVPFSPLVGGAIAVGIVGLILLGASRT
jgi:hypothetical protein